jgi:hypothetical protein
MTSELLSVLQHALGLDAYGRGEPWRNHYVVGFGTPDWAVCSRAVASGLMTRSPGHEISGGDDVFRVTEAGRAWVAAESPPPPQLTRSQRRYRRYLAEDSGMSFGAWLRARRVHDG